MDEMVAAGDWSEFVSSGEVLSDEAAVAILEARKAAANGIVDAIAPPPGGLAVQPFMWRGRVFRVLRAVFDHGRTEVAVAPPDAEFEAELRRRIEADRFHTLGYFQGFGFACFPEDHAKYRG
ncbi:MAG: hypothetical protein ACRC7O_05390 [Fimbriiglobus sp.]